MLALQTPHGNDTAHHDLHAPHAHASLLVRLISCAHHNFRSIDVSEPADERGPVLSFCLLFLFDRRSLGKHPSELKDELSAFVVGTLQRLAPWHLLRIAG